MRMPRCFSACWWATLRRREEALNQAAGFLRNGLFKRLHIHTVPTLHFLFDRTTERAADMNALIAQGSRIPFQNEDEHSGHGTLARQRTDGSHRRPVHGVLLLDKPLGLSSNDALAKGQMAAARGEGGPHRHARPAGHRVCCRCALVRPPSSASCSWTPTRPTRRWRAGRDHHHRRCRGRGAAARTVVRQLTAERLERVCNCSSPAHPAGAADVQRAQEGRQGLVRVCACGHRSGARAAGCHHSCIESGFDARQ
jgi:hypothetical protein